MASYHSEVDLLGTRALTFSSQSLRNICFACFQDGLRLTIQFVSQEGEYELDADTQEDKNSVYNTH